MSVLLTFDIEGKSYNIIVDASCSETHSGSAQVTEHQVEVGSNITDHVRPVPDKVSITGIVSETPILRAPRLPSTIPNKPPAIEDITNGYSGIQAVSQTNNITGGGNVRGTQFSAKPTRIRDTEAALSKARSYGALITVYTSLKYYENMVIENLSITRDAKTTNVLKFTMDLKKIVLISTQVTQSRTPKKKKVAKGNKAPTPDPEKKIEDKKSVLHNGVAKAKKLLSGFFGG